MKFSDKTWGCGNALTYIFFSDHDRISGELDYRKAVKEELIHTLNNQSSDDRFELLEEKDLNLIKQVARSIRLHPAKITGKSQFAPIVWLKLALQISFTGLPIAHKFMKRYSEWREDCEQLEKLALVVQVISDANSTTKKSSKKNDKLTYSLDVFLLTDIADFNPSKYTYSIRYKAIAIDEKVPTQRVSSEKLTKRQIGTGVYLEFKECITEAAEGGYIPNELRRIPKMDRYKFSKSRLELLNSLRKRFPGKLNYSDPVCVRAISEFVACGKYKRSK